MVQYAGPGKKFWLPTLRLILPLHDTKTPAYTQAEKKKERKNMQGKSFF